MDKNRPTVLRGFFSRSSACSSHSCCSALEEGGSATLACGRSYVKVQCGQGWVRIGHFSQPQKGDHRLVSKFGGALPVQLRKAWRKLSASLNVNHDEGWK